jgi:hypothetical protein
MLKEVKNQIQPIQGLKKGKDATGIETYANIWSIHCIPSSHIAPDCDWG